MPEGASQQKKRPVYAGRYQFIGDELFCLSELILGNPHHHLV